MQSCQLFSNIVVFSLFLNLKKYNTNLGLMNMRKCFGHKIRTYGCEKKLKPIFPQTFAHLHQSQVSMVFKIMDVNDTGDGDLPHTTFPGLQYY